jgi:hypothetical protein
MATPKKLKEKATLYVPQRLKEICGVSFMTIFGESPYNALDYQFLQDGGVSMYQRSWPLNSATLQTQAGSVP